MLEKSQKDPASSVCVHFCIYWCFVVYIFLLFMISIVHVLQWHKHRSGTGVANPKVLHFSSLTEALQPKLLIYLIWIFVHNMTLKPQESQHEHLMPLLAFMFLLSVWCVKKIVPKPSFLSPSCIFVSFDAFCLKMVTETICLRSSSYLISVICSCSTSPAFALDKVE